MAKALVGMSGGVDSSVSAYLVMQAELECIGATMVLFPDPSECCTPNQLEDARKVTEKLGIPFFVLDFSSDFRKNVMDHFVASYEKGLTPNPCIECNKHLKFSQFMNSALEMGCDYVVTGHYAQIRKDERTGRFLLCKAADAAKDQSYFLSGLTQHQLSHTLFPLGGLTKSEVRAIAEAQGFINAKKRDSQDICFIPDGDYYSFLKRYTGKDYTPGDYLDLNGKTVGKHQGAAAYTIGQRKGLGIALGEPMYVCSKDMTANTVTLGPNDALFHTTLLADNWNWFPFPTLTNPIKVNAKARSRMFEQPATAYPQENGLVKIVFDEPQRALTPGQAIVLYNGDVVVGGGTILCVI